MGNINPEGKTPHGRGSGAMPSVATGTAWENPAQTGAEPGTVFPGKRQHHLPRKTGPDPRRSPVCAHRNGVTTPPGAASGVPRDHQS